jgi:hypothetical protein
MLSESGRIMVLNDHCRVYVSHEARDFKDTMNLLTSMQEIDENWQLASIAKVEKHEKTLRQLLRDENMETIEVWVSDLIELETGNLNIPKFYSCDINLSKPKNGSIALKQYKCAALFFWEKAAE